MTDIVFTNTEIPRDRLGRPLVVPPGDARFDAIDGAGRPIGDVKRISYRRVTTFVKALEDTYAIEEWKKRLVAYGMGQRHDLQLAASALSLDESHKRKLQRVADDALEVAQGSAAATVGTALHGHTETIDRGLPLGFVPPPFDADIEAYKRCTDGIEWLSVEGFRVKDDWQVAGTADRIGRDRHGRVRVYDVKTGQTAIDYPHSMAAQLALYSRCQPYNIETDTRGPIEDDLDLNTGIIIWLPAGQAHCELFEIDLGKGWGACIIAKQVWDWRGTKNLIEPVRDVKDPLTWDSLINAAKTVEDVRKIWTQMSRSEHLTDEYRSMLTRRADDIQNQVEGGPW